MTRLIHLRPTLLVLLLGLVALLPAAQTATPPPAKDTPPPAAVTDTPVVNPAITLHTTWEGARIDTVFRRGKAWCEELKPFPAHEKRLLVVELTITNNGSNPLYIYLDQIWLHMDEEDQRVAMVHAEELGPRIYQDPYHVRTDEPVDAAPPVEVYTGGPIYRNGQVILNPGSSGGVFVDLKRLVGKDGAPLTLKKFVLTLFDKEFNTTYIKPGQSGHGFLYFHLPWPVTSLAGMQLHLDEIFGGAEDIVLPLPPAPTPMKDSH